MWNSDIISGLVPTLFADNPEAASEALHNHPGKAHGDVAKINKAFLIPEELELVEALAFLKKPREGAAVFPYKSIKYKESSTSNKRLRVEEQGTDSGT